MTANEKKVYETSNNKNKFASAEEEREWARTQTKKCVKCEEKLPLTYFGGNTSSADHFDRHGIRLRRGDCLACNKLQVQGKKEAMNIAKSLGMPYSAPKETNCQLCHSTENIVFDHDHETKTFRGWLCDPCNRSLGRLGDNVEGIMKVLKYLNSHEKKKFAVDESGDIILV